MNFSYYEFYDGFWTQLSKHLPGGGGAVFRVCQCSRIFNAGFSFLFAYVCVGAFNLVYTLVGQGLRVREEARAKEAMDAKERLELAQVLDQKLAGRLVKEKEKKGGDWVWGKDGEVREEGGEGGGGGGVVL